MMNKYIFTLLVLFTSSTVFCQTTKHNFRIRTITAGITMSSLEDTTSFSQAIEFLKQAKSEYLQAGYEIQTMRISTQNFHEVLGDESYKEAILFLQRLDRIAQKDKIVVAIGAVLPPNIYDSNIAEWVVGLMTKTETISISLPISSKQYGIHEKAIEVAAEICVALSQNSKGGEANFRFTASANCPAGIPFFPAAFHKGEKSFAIGLESPNILTKVFEQSDWGNAKENLKQTLEKELKPVEKIANRIQISSGWHYDGIDTSPAPGLDASIGEAIEALTKKPFGSATTLSACALITGVLKNLNIKTCGYSGLMLPIIEDKVLAKRAIEKRFTVDELLLFSSVSGTGLDVVPIPGNTSVETIKGIYRDVAALSLKYSNKALSARLFPIPEKEEGELVEFDNPYLTPSTVMKVR